MGKQCQICGENGYLYYPFCKKHLEMKSNGLLQKCENCGKWYIKGEKCSCQNENKEPQEKSKTETFEKKDTYTKTQNYTNEKYENCIICGQPSNGLPQCEECYKETLDYMDGLLDKNAKISELRDYYYNLKDRIYQIKNIEYVKSNCNKLIAIAMQNKKTNNDQFLTSIVYKDILQIFKSKNQRKNKNQEENKDDEKNDDDHSDENKERIIPAYDGHIVKSDPEREIDDILWNYSILHAYGQAIVEFTYERKKSDWFIPITGHGKYQGIYIEYWGMNTPKYNKARKEKEDLYEKYNVPYIGIEREALNDKYTFKDNLIRDIGKKAEEYFHFIPSWGVSKKSNDN